MKWGTERAIAMYTFGIEEVQFIHRHTIWNLKHSWCEHSVCRKITKVHMNQNEQFPKKSVNSRKLFVVFSQRQCSLPKKLLRFRKCAYFLRYLLLILINNGNCFHHVQVHEMVELSAYFNMTGNLTKREKQSIPFVRDNQFSSCKPFLIKHSLSR